VANALLLGLLALAAFSVLLSTETSRSLWMLVGLSLALTRIEPAAPPQASAETSLDASSSSGARARL
jgi:hypothetical protein